MAIGANSSGSLKRTTNLPSNVAGWTFNFWLRFTASGADGNFLSLDDAGGNWIQFGNSGGTSLYVYAGGGTYGPIVNPGTNWINLTLRASGTSLSWCWRTESATSLSTGNPGGAIGVNTFTGVYLMNSGYGELTPTAQMCAFKFWNAALSDAEVWEESQRSRPKRTANLDSYLPFYTASGTDEGGLGRNWTIVGTPVTASTQPSVPVGGASRARVILPLASTTITGTGAATLPGMSASGSDAAGVTSTGAASLPGMSAAGSAQQTIGGSGAVVRPGATVAGSATETISGTGAAASPGLTGAGASGYVIGSTGAAASPGLTAAASGGVAIGGTGASALPGLTGAGAAAETIGGTGAATLPGLIVSGTAPGQVSMTGAAGLPGMSASGSATETIASSGAATLPGMTVAGAAVETIAGTGAATRPGMTAAGSAPGLVVASGAAGLPGMTGAASATQTIAASGASSLPGMSAAGSAVETIGASGAAARAGLTAVGSATELIGGAGASALAGSTASGSAVESIGGTGAAVRPGMTALGTGAPSITASGAATLPGMSASGAALESITGIGSATLASRTAAGAQAAPITGTGALLRPGMLALGTAVMTIGGTGAALLPGMSAASVPPPVAASVNAPYLPSRSTPIVPEPAYTRVINVTGLVNDGITDNVTVLRAAIAAAVAGDCLVIPAGNYVSSGLINLTVDNVTVKGAGSASTRIIMTTHNSCSWRVRASNHRLQGITIDSINSTGRTGTNLQGSSTLVLDARSVAGARCDGFYGFDVVAKGAEAAGVFAYGASNYVFDMCVSKNSLADSFHNTAGCSYGRFYDCVAMDGGDDSFAFVHYDGDPNDYVTHDMSLSRCQSYRSHARCFAVLNCYGVDVVDFYGEQSYAAGIYIVREIYGSLHTGGGDRQPCYNITMSKSPNGWLRIVDCNTNAPTVNGMVYLSNVDATATYHDITISDLEIVDSRSSTQAVRAFANNGGTVSSVTLNRFKFFGRAPSALTGGNVTFGPTTVNAVSWDSSTLGARPSSLQVNVIQISGVASGGASYAPQTTRQAPIVAEPTYTRVVPISGLIDSATTGDNLTAIKNALTAAVAGDCLTLPAGNFRCSGLIDVKTKNVTVKGAGSGLTRIIMTTSNSCSWRVRTDNHRLQGVTIESVSTTARTSTNLQGSATLVIDGKSAAGVTCDGFYAYDVVLRGAEACASYANGATNYTFDRVTAQNSLANGFQNTSGCAFGTYYDCAAIETGDDGLTILHYDGDLNEYCSHDISAYRYQALRCKGRGLAIINTFNIYVEDMALEATSACGLYIVRELVGGLRTGGDRHSVYGVVIGRSAGGYCRIINTNVLTTTVQSQVFIQNIDTTGDIHDVTVNDLEFIDARANTPAVKVNANSGSVVTGVTMNRFKFWGRSANGTYGGNVVAGPSTVVQNAWDTSSIGSYPASASPRMALVTGLATSATRFFAGQADGSSTAVMYRGLAPVVDMSTHQPPSYSAPVPELVRTGRWRISFTPAISSASWTSDQLIWCFDNSTGNGNYVIMGAASGGACALVGFTSGPYAFVFASVTFSAGQTLTLDMDMPNGVTTLTGATNGTLQDVRAPYAFVGSTITSYAPFPFQGSLSDIYGYFPSGTGALGGSTAGFSTCTVALTSVAAITGVAAGASAPTATVRGGATLGGTSVGASTCAASAIATRQASMSSAGASVAGATLTARGALAGTAAGASNVVGATNSATGGLSSGVGTATCAIAAGVFFTGASSSVSACSAALTGAGAIAGASGSNADVTGTLRPVVGGSSAGVSTCTLTMAAPGVGSGASAGLSTCTGLVTARGALAGVSAGASTCGAALSATAAFAGGSAGASAPTGALAGTGAVAGTSVGVSIVGGTFNAVAPFGTAAGEASCSGALVATGLVVGASSGVSVASAAVTGQASIAGTSTNASGITCLLVGAGALGGTSSGAGAATCAADTGLHGTSAGTSDASCALTGAGVVAGASAGNAICVAEVTTSRAGTSKGVATADCVIVGLGAVAGTAEGTATAAGSGTSAAFAAGNADGVSTVTLAVSALAQLSGVASGGASSAAATLTGQGAMLGGSDGSADALASLIGRTGILGTSEGSSTATCDASVSTLAIRLVASGGSSAAATLIGTSRMRGTSDGGSASAGTFFGHSPEDNAAPVVIAPTPPNVIALQPKATAPIVVVKKHG